jgi:predicted Zn-dependent protease
MRWHLLVLALLAGCATTKQAPQNPIRQSWIPKDPAYWQTMRHTGVTLNTKDGGKRFVSASVLNNVLTAKERIEKVSGVNAELALVDTELPNAFATTHQGRAVIAISLSYLDRLGNDADAIATTVGHELAHVHLGHSGAVRKEREEKAKSFTNVAGSIANQIIPFSGYLVGVAATAVVRGFTRDEERDADNHGLRWAIAAGFDPCGKSRAVSAFAAAGGGTSIPFLSTHPSYGERSDLANEYSRKTSGRDC